MTRRGRSSCTPWPRREHWTNSSQVPSPLRPLPSLMMQVCFMQSQLEVQIHNMETSYLTETAAHSGGNIIHGFDGYLKNQPSGRRKYEISEQDRIFSVSSQTYKKVRIAQIRPFKRLESCRRWSCPEREMSRPRQGRTSQECQHLALPPSAFLLLLGRRSSRLHSKRRTATENINGRNGQRNEEVPQHLPVTTRACLVESPVKGRVWRTMIRSVEFLLRLVRALINPYAD